MQYRIARNENTYDYVLKLVISYIPQQSDIYIRPILMVIHKSIVNNKSPNHVTMLICSYIAICVWYI